MEGGVTGFRVTLRMDVWFLAPGSGGEKVPAGLQIHGGIKGMYTSCFYFGLKMLAAADYRGHFRCFTRRGCTRTSKRHTGSLGLD